MNEELPCKNCITYPICQTVYNQTKNSTSKIFLTPLMINNNNIDYLDRLQKARVKLENRCSIIREWVEEGLDDETDELICVEKNFNINSIHETGYGVLEELFYNICSRDLTFIIYFDNNEESFHILDDEEYKKYLHLQDLHKEAFGD